MKQALERSEQNFVTKIKPHTLLGVCTTCPCQMGYPKPSPKGHYRSKSEGRLLLNIKKLFMKQPLERGEQNFVTKLNHAPHLTWGLYYMFVPNGLPQAQSQGAL